MTELEEARYQADRFRDAYIGKIVHTEFHDLTIDEIEAEKKRLKEEFKFSWE